MNPHFFTAPFYFAFIWFKVQGSGLSWRLRRNYIWAMPDQESFSPPSSGRGQTSEARRGWHPRV